MNARHIVVIAGTALLGASAFVPAQQPVTDAPSGNPSSNAGTTDAAATSPSSERILWDQLAPKYRRASSGGGQITIIRRVVPPDKLPPPGSTVIITEPSK